MSTSCGLIFLSPSTLGAKGSLVVFVLVALEPWTHYAPSQPKESFPPHQEGQEEQLSDSSSQFSDEGPKKEFPALRLRVGPLDGEGPQ